MKIKNLILTIFSAVLLLASSQAYAIQKGSGIAMDNRIKTYVYAPNEVFIFTGHYRYQSMIELDPSETIDSIILGDSTGWSITPASFRIFLKPVAPDPITNMTIITNKRTYLFELHAEYADDISDEELAFISRFSYPGGGNSTANSASFITVNNLNTLKENPIPNAELSPDSVNLNYTLTGSKMISPLKVFDDGEFTYLQYKKINADIPAVFLVDKNGNESLINYRITDDYMVIERVSSQFTLRYGSEVACLFNESRPFPKHKKEKKFLGIF